LRATSSCDSARTWPANTSSGIPSGSEVPDMAAALGPHLINFSRVVERRLTDEQLRAGFTTTDGRVYRFANHRAYVKAYKDATKALVKTRLWDERLGNMYVAEAASSDVLR
jgi:hypothetical protein